MGNVANASAEAVSLPQGGGALQGIGEKFSPDLHTGTGNFSVPLALPQGRGGFGPQLVLAYSTGAGNGPFGLGWSLGVPAVTRRTARGVPRYRDAAEDPALRDVFILSGHEDLVELPSTVEGVRRYRPLTEGLFARIHHHLDTGVWEVQTGDGLISRYGAVQADGVRAVVADPEAEGRVFSWHLSETVDPFGNRVVYDYDREGAQAYLRRVRWVDFREGEETRFLASVELEYAGRPDPFSQHRAGFEVRTARRCTGLVVRTHAGEDRVVRRYRLEYLDEREELAFFAPRNGVSLLGRVTVSGEADGVTESLPPLELGYTRFEPEARRFSALAGEDLPARSLAHGTVELVDLFGSGLPDFLEMDGTVRWWRNLGGGRFDRPRTMAAAPAGLRLGQPGVQLVDADGDGRTDLLVTTPALSGYYPLAFGGAWSEESFRAYRRAPAFDLADPEVRLVDLDGDGVTDAVRAGTRLRYFRSEPGEGWDETAHAEAETPEGLAGITFADPRVRWADMNGDGLQDLVLVHDGRIDYWPSQGHGRWGRRVAMRGAPRLPRGYDPARLLLGDVDGDGAADLVYVEDGAVTVWINRSGNGWSGPVVVRGTPPAGGAHFRLADVLGNGIPGVLWSADAAAGRPHLHFLDLTGGVKPYLLSEVDNRTGAVTRVEYAPSTRFYAADQARPETRWKTTLPFPVHVVARTRVTDAVSGGRLTTEYAYRHGCWDGAEREFRGFGRVDQRDTESFAALQAARLRAPRPLAAVDEESFAPPLETRTWFHVGPVGPEHGAWEEADFSAEYWREPGTDPCAPGMLAPDEETAALLAGLPRRAARDAVRALRGRTLRSEQYALDGSPRADRPYTVAEHRWALREEEPPEDPCGRRMRVFFPHEVASRTTEWERGDDPMTRFAFTGDRDALGQPRLALSVAVPRGRDPLSEAEVDEPFLATLTVTGYAQAAPGGRFLGDRVAHATVWEIPDVTGGSVQALREQVLAGGGPARRIVSQALSFYDGPAFQGLPLGQVGSTGAATRTEQLVLTPEILAAAYGADLPPYLGGAEDWSAYPAEWRALLPAGAGYLRRSPAADGAPYLDGLYAVAEAREYDFQRGGEPALGLVRRTRDPLGGETVAEYDPYGLFPVEVRDAAGLVTTAEHDYRVLKPREVVDPNGNRRRLDYTPLGLPERVLILGREGEPVGDTPEAASVVHAYDFAAFAERGEPVSVRTVRRVWHALDPDAPAEGRDDVLETVEYTDGFGRLLQTRTLAEDVVLGDAVFGGAVLPPDPADAEGTRADVAGAVRAPDAPPHVVVSGWQRFDNKGRVVERWEPFFSTGWTYRTPGEERDVLGREVLRRSARLFYDARGREVRTLSPDGSERRCVYGVPADHADPDGFAPTPWEKYVYDAGDNSGRTHAADPGAAAYRHHRDTPASVVLDALGRTVESVERNRALPAGPDAPLPPVEELRTRTVLDVRGSVAAVVDALGRTAAAHVHDLAGRLLRAGGIDAGVRLGTFDAAGHPLERRDAKGGRSFRAYDAAGRPVRAWARDAAGEAVTLRERLVYGDSADAGLPDARARNLLGQLVRHYDEAGMVGVERCDFRGVVTERTRRVVRAERVLAVLDAAEGDGWRVRAWRMDWTPPPRTTFEEHAAALLDEREYRVSSRYDALGRPVSVRMPADVDGGRRTVQARFNRGGALEQVWMDGQVRVAHVAYDAGGRRTLVAYGNGVMTRRAYDPATFRLARVRSERFRRADGAAGPVFRPTDPARPLQDTVYRYDLVGNPLEIGDRAPGSGLPAAPDRLDRAFAYDALYRLLSATGRECGAPAPSAPWDDAPRCQDPTATRAYAEEYAYDAVGNLLRLAHRTASGSWAREHALAPGSNRLATVTSGAWTHAYEHDAVGNLVREDEARWMEWDHADRMRTFRVQTRTVGGDGAVRWDQPTVYTHHLYDAGGQRVARLVRRRAAGSELTVYVDGVFEHHVKIPGGRSPQPRPENFTVHLMDGEHRFATVRVGPAFEDETAPEHPVKFHLADHLGSGHLAVSGDGAWLNREEYTPYGESSFGGYARKRYRYTGKERDGDSGLYYHGARFYAPWTGRWASCDPLGPRDGPNLYLYCHANPLRFVDPTGCQAEATLQSPAQDLEIPVDEASLADRFRESSWGQLAGGIVMGTAAAALPFIGAAVVGTMEKHGYMDSLPADVRAGMGIGMAATGTVQAVSGVALMMGGGGAAGGGLALAPVTGGVSLVGSAAGLGAVGVGAATTAAGGLNVGVGGYVLSRAWGRGGGGGGGPKWVLRNVKQSDVKASQRGYQVYVLRDRKGNVLYVGKSGGAGGKTPQSWVERVRAHIKDSTKKEWIGETNRISVTAELTEQEAFALEQELIAQHRATAHNVSAGEFSIRFPQSSLADNVQSAGRMPTYHFQTDIVP
ncbi:MAG: SpvB/TcaC N-terminal domain-containing protein [Gemmatimonadota bacterium]